MENNASGKSWINHTNIYEVNLRQYTPEGTFAAFAKHLPRLKAMGVKTLWFMPLTPIAQKGRKGSLGSPYAAADYTSINPELGTMEDWNTLVRQAHSDGFKIIIDWVANHTGWDHVWTKTNPDFYKKDPATGEFKIASGMDDIIELDYNNPALRRAMIDAMKFWIQEYDIDGFRCDLASWVEAGFWIEAARELNASKPLLWLGELDPLESPEYMQVFDAGYAWKWMHKTREFYQQGQNVQGLDSLLRMYSHARGMQAWFTTNHDENTWNGTESEKYGDAAPALAVFSCTWPGLPLVYSGQELPNLKRLQFFERDPIDWNSQPKLEGFYKTLLNLHSEHPALNGDAEIVPVLRIHSAQDDKILAYVRTSGDRQVLSVLNLSRDSVTFEMPVSAAVEGTFREVFYDVQHDFNIHKTLELKPWQYLVYEK